MAKYMEYVEAVQFTGHSVAKECIALIERCVRIDNWMYTDDAIKVWSGGHDSYQYHVKLGDWVVLRQGAVLEIISDNDFSGRYHALPEAAP